MSKAFNTDVTVTIEAAFGSNPFDASPSWTDITADARSVWCKRGRSKGGFDRAQIGQARIVLNNQSGDYTPDNTAGAYTPDIKPNTPVRVRATYDSTTYDLFTGVAARWLVEFPGKVHSAVTVECFDSAKVLQRRTVTGSYSEEASHTRIGNILDSADWPAAARSLSTGAFTMQAHSPDDENAWSLLHLVADTEGGLVFVDGAGDLVFQDFDYRLGLSTTGTFGPGASEVRISEATPDSWDDDIYNKVTVTPRVQDGEVVGTSAYDLGVFVAEATGSQAAYEVVPFTRSDTLHAVGGQAFALASQIVTEYKQPEFGVRTLTTQPVAAEADYTGAWDLILGLEVSQRWTVKVEPPAGDTITQDTHVESVTHEFTFDKDWRTTVVASGRPELELPGSALYPSSTLYPD